MDLPSERARCACFSALRFQVALRILRLDLDVFFLGTAMTAYAEIFHNLSSIQHIYSPDYALRRKAFEQKFVTIKPVGSAPRGAIAFPIGRSVSRNV